MPKNMDGKPVKNMGKSIEKERRRRVERMAAQPNGQIRALGVSEGQDKRSVLEQSSLDEFLAEAELANASFESTRGERPRAEGPKLVSTVQVDLSPAALEQRAATARRLSVPIPWRPLWREGMSAEELASAEGDAFLEWRRGLAKIEEKEALVMTPFERNLDFWRQLWRCVERSGLVVQILDCRDPEFYRSKDLERYVQRFPGKRHLLLLNKADFLTPELRSRWKAHFKGIGVEVVFFSALRELHKQQRLPTAATESAGAPDAAPAQDGEAVPALPPHGPLFEEESPDVVDCQGLVEELRSRLGEGGQQGGSSSSTVGFVGYPNVGKSSVINALFGAKKVSMSRTPGKTKHLQTLELPELGLTLCDCPGLVFPSVVATKAHLVINGTVPLTELRDTLPPVRLVLAKVGLGPLLEKYGLDKASLREGAARLGEDANGPAEGMLAALALTRQHFRQAGVPHVDWAARRVLRDFCTGELLHCETPVDSPPHEAARPVAAPPPAAPAAAAAAPEPEEDDFSDLDDFLAGRGEAEEDSKPKKRGAAKKKGK